MLHCTNLRFNSGCLSRSYVFYQIFFNKFNQMKSEQNSNSGTFPSGDHRGVQPEYGLSKREYFAGLALQGILSSNEFAHIHSACNRAITIADELLKQLSE